LKKGFFMPLTPEEERCYRQSCCEGSNGGLKDENDDCSSSSSSSSCSSNGSGDEMDISPKKIPMKNRQYLELEVEEMMQT
jgi:hypothetical protein